MSEKSKKKGHSKFRNGSKHRKSMRMNRDKKSKMAQSANEPDEDIVRLVP